MLHEERMRIFDCCQAAEKYCDGLCAEWAGWEGQCMACGRGYLQDGITTNPLKGDDDDDDDDDDDLWLHLDGITIPVRYICICTMCHYTA